MVTTTAIYSREQLGISRTLLGEAISSACHPGREIHLLSADAPFRQRCSTFEEKTRTACEKPVV